MSQTLFRRAAAFALGLGLFAVSADAQELPPAKELVAKYQQAIGGKDVLAKYESMHTKGEFSMPAAGITAPFEAWSARPNRATMLVSIPGFGDIRQGYSGDVAWSMNPMEGPRVMEEAEAKQAADEADFDSSLRLDTRIANMETVELTKLGGKDCYKVRVEWKSGRESFDCYSPETGLMVGTISTQESNMGQTQAITIYDDYKDFSGFRMPSRMTVQVMGMEQVILVNDVTFDAAPETAFELPAEIKALVRK